MRPLRGGYRNTVLLVETAGERHIAKSTRRSEAALRWAENAMHAAQAAGFVTPAFVPSIRGRLVEDGVTVETFIEGEPASQEDLVTARRFLERFHQETRDWPQRPGFASATELLELERGGDVDLSEMPSDLVEICRLAWRVLAYEPVSVVHGDLNSANVLRTPNGLLVLLDWDEARRDASVFDTAALEGEVSHAVARALLAWEVAVSWRVEPQHARAQAERLFTF